MGLELARRALLDRRAKGDARIVLIFLALLGDDATGRVDLSHKLSAEEIDDLLANIAVLGDDATGSDPLSKPSREELAEYHAEMRRFEQGSRRHGL